MTTLFISDLHLQAARPDLTHQFEHFISHLSKVESLYILGDLFEYWLGDDVQTPLSQQVAQILTDCAKKGVKLYFLVGNRDFLLGKKYAASCAMEMIVEPTVISLYGKPILLMHGDSLCTGDIAYQQFRKQVRDPKWQSWFLAQSLDQRRALAAQARDASIEHTGKADSEIMDVTPQEVINTMQQYQVDCLIHGHTHRPYKHEIKVDGFQGQRWVLGDWGRNTTIMFLNEKKGCLQKLSDVT